MSAQRVASCDRCGDPIVQSGPGRRRKFCETCRPPSSSAATAQAWRLANPDKVEAYNLARRVHPVPLVCVECGAKFEGRRGRLVCSRRCKDARYRKANPVVYAAKQARKYGRRKARKLKGA